MKKYHMVKFFGMFLAIISPKEKRKVLRKLKQATKKVEAAANDSDER